MRRIFLPLGLETPLDLDATLDCGQAFRWRKVGEWWYGVIGEAPFALCRTTDGLQVKSTCAHARVTASHYLALDHDLPAILASFDRDEHTRRAIEACRGMRIVRQPLWECVASFVCATMSNIPRIKLMLERVCGRLGEDVEFDGQVLQRFPVPEAIAATTQEQLRGCGLGYRAQYLHGTARAFADGSISERELREADTATARAMLMTLPGIGPKAAECILLFGLQRLDRVPVDVWIKRLFCELYGVGLCAKRSLTPADHVRIGEWARGYFGGYAGYAQQYLFHAARAIGRATP